MEIRWIDRDGAASVPADRIRELVTRDEGIVWAHLDHDDEFGMSLLIMTVAPRPEDLREVSSRTPVPRLHMYSDHHFSAINGLVRGSDGLLHLQPVGPIRVDTGRRTITFTTAMDDPEPGDIDFPERRRDSENQELTEQRTVPLLVDPPTLLWSRRREPKVA